MDEIERVEEPPNMAWMLTFADLVSLLITFFVLLYSMKDVNETKWNELTGTFQNVFEIRKKVMDARPDNYKSVESIDNIQSDNLIYIQQVLSTRFQDDPVLRNVTSEPVEGKDALAISLPSNLLFDSGSVVMKEIGAKAIRRLGDILRHLDNRVEVGGHTDPLPISTLEFPTNWELAMLRAMTVARVLQQQGVGENIMAVSYGDSRFNQIDPYLSEVERYQRSRRVDIIVFGDQVE